MKGQAYATESHSKKETQQRRKEGQVPGKSTLSKANPWDFKAGKRPSLVCCSTFQTHWVGNVTPTT